jgi:hypothetical protein
MPRPIRSIMRAAAKLLAIFVAIATNSASLHCVAQTTTPRQFDANRVAAAGVRVLEGRYVRLVTDLPSSPAVDELPRVFDDAVPKWAAYFGLTENAVRGRWLAVLVKDRERFAALGLLPEDNPEFTNGYAKGYELWLVDQPSDYYRRHLLLHEGTHAFMQTQLGGCGAPWYMEGVAELLGTHTWRDGQSKLGVMPASREVVPMWGRIKLIRDAFADGKAWPLEAVLAIDNARALTTEHYAWTWALATLLERHPQFSSRFRGLQKRVADPEFKEHFRAAFAKDWSDMLAEWEALVAQLDYGYDVPQMAMVHRPAKPIGAPSQTIKISADRGWQSTGWILNTGQSYRVAASGRYQIAHDGEPWPCEPGGVTLQYHDGKPLGALLGALRPLDENGASFAQPVMLGLTATLKPAEDAVLYVRVNDSGAKLGDNSGELSLRIETLINANTR